uniref:Essential MCU regulator, mitochondrial n=1 Tax=Onchocerca volvulus TaxID=6282 RepID=A0A8R1Y2U0_ONCVO
MMNKIGILLTRLRTRFIDQSLSSPTPISLESTKVDSLPYTLPFGIFMLLAVTISSIGFGAFLAKETAQFLRDNEIFVPKEEND